jgi:hypothetical protein
MAEKKNTITRADALKAAIAYAQADSNEQVAATLERMLASITRPRAKQVSKARVVNEKLAAWLRDYVSANGDGATAKDVVAAGNPAITSPQKASAVAAVAEELGYIRRNKSGKVTTYTLA